MTDLELKSKLMKKHRVDIVFEELSYHVAVPKQKEKKAVLKSVSGNFKSGQMTAIMGPSGAGKSSLLNILTGFTKAGVSGNIQFGQVRKSRKLCAYIMQDDHFYSWFNVAEIMMLAASLKISQQSMSLQEKQILIDNILHTLKLLKSKTTKCGQLSGGQKKRLSIALELIDNPSVLFLDEPTTGLDSSSSYDTIKLLQLLAQEDRTVVCTIHQPSSNIFNLFDQIYVLSSGYCTYRGAPTCTVEFLKSVGLECPSFHNPADFLLECVNGDYGDHTAILASAAQSSQWSVADEVESLTNGNHLQKRLEANGIKKETTTMLSSQHMYPPAEWMSLWLLIGRCHVQFFRDWTVTYLKLFVHICCAIIIGLLFGDSGSNATKQISNSASFLVHLVYLWYTNMMPGVLRFPQEISIIKKETFNNWYKLRSYYVATLITSTPIHIMFSTAYISIIYILTDQPWELQRFVKFLLIVVTITISADGFGILLGTILNPVNGTFIGAISACFMIIFSGFLILVQHMSKFMQIITYISPMRYGFDSMITSIYANNRSDMRCPDEEMYCHFKNPSMILNTFGANPDDYGFNLLMIVLQTTLFKACAYFTLRLKIKRST